MLFDQFLNGRRLVGKVSLFLTWKEIQDEVPSADGEEVMMRGAPELVSVNKERIGR
jgi:hypothetical protein